MRYEHELKSALQMRALFIQSFLICISVRCWTNFANIFRFACRANKAPLESIWSIWESKVGICLSEVLKWSTCGLDLVDFGTQRWTFCFQKRRNNEVLDWKWKVIVPTTHPSPAVTETHLRPRSGRSWVGKAMPSIENCTADAPPPRGRTHLSDLLSWQIP